MKSLKLIAISLLGLNLVGNSCWGSSKPQENSQNEDQKPKIISQVVDIPIGNPNVNNVLNIDENRGPIRVGSNQIKDIKNAIVAYSSEISKTKPSMQEKLKGFGFEVEFLSQISKDIVDNIVSSIRNEINSNEELKDLNESDEVTADVLAIGVWKSWLFDDDKFDQVVKTCLSPIFFEKEEYIEIKGKQNNNIELNINDEMLKLEKSRNIGECNEPTFPILLNEEMNEAEDTE